MTWTHDDRVLATGWAISLAVHAVAVGLALAFAAQIKPVLQEDVFQWEVALVQAVDPEPAFEQTEPAAEPAQPTAHITPVPPVEPTPEAVTHSVAPQQSAQVIHPVMEPVKPIEQKVEPTPQPKIDPVEQKVEPVQPKIEPIEQKVVEVARQEAEAVVEAKEPEPVRQAEPVVAASQPVAVAALTEPVEARQPHETITPASAAVPSQEAPAPQAAPMQPSQQESHQSSAHHGKDAPSVADAAPAQVAKATGPEAKADHRWLAESLWRRVAELKRYPSFARLNGLEGKVVLKAVIRSDGHLAEVSVQRSSGHSVLDAAAMEAVKLACPLHMKHAINKPEVVVSLPIVYSLAN